MLTKNHEKLTLEVKRHIEADALVQGAYWDGSRGCFIGCLAHSNKAEKLGELYGLPLPLVRICEDIFENLPADEAKAFFAAIPDAVGRDGKDLTRVHWAFLASELRELPKTDADTQSAIDTVIDGMDVLASGGTLSEETARAARAAAAAAHAVRAAAYAARASAYTARAARAAAAAAHAADAAVLAAASAYTARAVLAAAAAHAARGVVLAADAAALGAYRAARGAYRAVRLRQRDTIIRLISEA